MENSIYKALCEDLVMDEETMEKIRLRQQLIKLTTTFRNEASSATDLVMLRHLAEECVHTVETMASKKASAQDDLIRLVALSEHLKEKVEEDPETYGVFNIFLQHIPSVPHSSPPPS